MYRADPLHPAPPSRPPGGRLRVLAACALLAGCAATGVGGSTPAPQDTQGSTENPAARPEPAIVRVRLPSSSGVSVVAWMPDATAYGLRAAVERDGSLHTGQRRGDHHLYLSTFFVQDMGGFVHVTDPSGSVLLTNPSVYRDLFACEGGRECSPMETVQVNVPDQLLRAHPDSLVVRFHHSLGRHWTVTLRRDLIQPYLQVVDSVVAARRRR